MNIAEHRSQFEIAIFSSEVELGAELKVQLAHSGYGVSLITNEELYFELLKSNTPHVVILDLKSLNKALSQLLEQAKSISSEIKYIFLSSYDTFDLLTEYKNYGFENVIDPSGVMSTQRILWEVDHVCEKIFQQYQNEQLFVAFQNANKMGHLQTQVKQESAVYSHVVKLHLNNRIAKYKSAESKEEMMQYFFENTSTMSWLYFKFIPSINSFVVVSSQNVNAAEAEGLTFQVDLKQIKDFMSQFTLGVVPPEMIQFVEKKLKLKLNKALPLFIDEQLEGAFVTPTEIPDDFNEEFSLFSMTYQLSHLERKIKSLEIYDPLTQLFNRNYYNKKLEEEVYRAKRTSQPLSIVKISVDQLEGVQKEIGEMGKDLLLKRVTEQILKTSRTNDFNCRLSENEFVMVLPSSHRKGAAIRAERLRRLVETSLVMESGQKITISQGISEYPSLCGSSSSLDETASKALSHIREKGQNKICIFKASEGFQPDFHVVVD